MDTWAETEARLRAMHVAVAYVGAERVGVMAQAFAFGLGVEAVDGVIDVVARSESPATLGAAVRAALGRQRDYPPGSELPTRKELAALWTKRTRRFGATGQKQMSRDFVRVTIVLHPGGTLEIVAKRGDGRGNYLGSDAGPAIELSGSTNDAELGRAVLDAVEAAPPAKGD